MKKPDHVSRRRFLAATAIAGTGTALGSRAMADPVVTPPQGEGPFYPIVDQADKDADLTVVEGRDGVAQGEVVEVSGRVLDAAGEPIANAVVDIWQANAAGRYAHEADPNPAALDPNFQGWAIMTTDEKGAYRFKTIKPGAYPATSDWSRPPHIHFKVSRRGYKDLTTQMYFEGEPLNDADALLNGVAEDLRAALIATPNEKGVLQFDVVLESV